MLWNVTQPQKARRLTAWDNTDGPRGHYTERCESEEDKCHVISLTGGIKQQN